jgi:hypothetical protein
VEGICVGTLQRREIEARRGLAQGGFDYNEDPTSSCHTFCWKARHLFDVPFFWPSVAPLRMPEVDSRTIEIDVDRATMLALIERSSFAP